MALIASAEPGLLVPMVTRNEGFPVASRLLPGSNRGKEYSLECQRLTRLSPEPSFPVVPVACKLLKTLVTRLISTTPPYPLWGYVRGGSLRWGLWGTPTSVEAGGGSGSPHRPDLVTECPRNLLCVQNQGEQ